MKDAAHPERRSGGGVPLPAASLLLLLPAFFVYLAERLGHGRAGIVYNSDLLYPYLLVQDLLRDPGAWSGWYHSPALYAFPDWFMAAAVMALPVPPVWWPLLYGPAILALYCVAGGMVLANAGIARTSAGAWAMAAAALAAGAGAAAGLGATVSTMMTASLAAPNIHTGAILSALLSVALLLRVLHGPPRRAAPAALAALVAVSSFSDPIFMVWFVGPAAIAAALHAYARRERRGWYGALIVLGTGAAGLAIGLGINPVWIKYAETGRASGGNAYAAFAEFARSIAESGDIVTIAVAGLSLLAIARGAAVVLRVARRRGLGQAEFLDLILAGIVAATILAPLVSNSFKVPAHFRLFLILMPVAALGVARLLLRLLPADGRRAWLAPGFALLVAAALTYPAITRLPQVLAAPALLQRCIEANGRTTGLADYWTAKLVMFTSGLRLHVIQVIAGGQRFPWIYKERWFTHRADDDSPARPDFIVPTRLDAAALRARFGPPAREVACGGQSLWLYDAPLPLPK